MEEGCHVRKEKDIENRKYNSGVEGDSNGLPYGKR